MMIIMLDQLGYLLCQRLIVLFKQLELLLIILFHVKTFLVVHLILQHNITCINGNFSSQIGASTPNCGNHFILTSTY